MTKDLSSSDKWELMAQMQIVIQLLESPMTFPAMLEFFDIVRTQQENQFKSHLAALERKGLIHSDEDMIYLDGDIQEKLAELSKVEVSKRIMIYLTQSSEE